jgi:septal ring factor EnvC (AmiA/AmiB activator)
VETQAPVERTENFYRFRVDARPKTTTRFTVNEKISISESVEIQHVSQDVILSWVNSKYINTTIAGHIQELVSLNSTVSALQHRIDLLKKEIETIFTNQERLRENLKALGNSESERGLRDRYVSELSAEEDKLREHRDAINALKEEKEETENELYDRLAALEFEQML